MVDRVLERGQRFDLGERTLIVMTPKVAQKSYGNEKRCVRHVFLSSDDRAN
jgi:hypothetical protein